MNCQVFLFVIALMCMLHAESYKLKSRVKVVSIKQQTSSHFSIKSTKDDSIERIDGEREELLRRKKKEYDDKLLRDAMQYTENQKSFFSIAKYLFPLILLAWGYTSFSGPNTGADF